jgi:Ca-activated chloride channel homolog
MAIIRKEKMTKFFDLPKITPNYQEENVMRKLIYLIFCLMLILFCRPLYAGVETESGYEKTLAPYFYVETGDASIDSFPLKETSVEADISGVIADVTVIQKYENKGILPINARYIFPASTRAAVHGMTMTVGENVIQAKIQEKQAAQQQFDQAKKEGRTASMLNQHRPNVFSMNVANIMPGDCIEIRLQYSEFLVPTDATYEFVFPGVVGPRYSSQPESGAAENDLWVKNPYLKQGTPDQTKFHMIVHLSTGISLQEVLCKTHKTDISYENSAAATIHLAGSETDGGNRDFILNYRLSGRQIQSGLLLYKGEHENFFALMIQPPDRVEENQIPNREYIFLVDVSGSMNGFPLNVSKRLLESLIGNLRPVDKFNVVLFSGGSYVMSPISVAADQGNINRAIAVINNQQGGGGTELGQALKTALALPKDENASRTIVIVTDGYIDAERDVCELISKNLNRSNVFSFGIGSSVNRYLIEGMARAGQGEPFIVTDPGEAEAAALRFREYIRSPLLSHIQVSYQGFDAYAVEPATIPDLFAKRPLIIFGKWRNEARGVISLMGMTGNGKYEQTVNVAQTAPSDINSPLRYLWARHKIALLSDFNPSMKTSEHQKEITSLGLTYNLLTQYTSFIAVSESISNPSGHAEDVNQPLPLPKNVSNLAVGGGCTTVPEPDLTMMAVGLLFGVVLLTAIKRKRRYAKIRHAA